MKLLDISKKKKQKERKKQDANHGRQKGQLELYYYYQRIVNDVWEMDQRYTYRWSLLLFIDFWDN